MVNLSERARIAQELIQYLNSGFEQRTDVEYRLNVLFSYIKNSRDRSLFEIPDGFINAFEDLVKHRDEYQINRAVPNPISGTTLIDYDFGNSLSITITGEQIGAWRFGYELIDDTFVVYNDGLVNPDLPHGWTEFVW